MPLPESPILETVVVCNAADRIGRRLKLATTIASKSPVATVGTKRLINYSRDHSVNDGELCDTNFGLRC